jgi:uncharacterized protein YbjQ (UPF0145 family)
MVNIYQLFIAALTAAAIHNVYAVEISDMQVNSYVATDPDHVLVLYDNPMEQHKVISVVNVHGYDVKDATQLKAAIAALKQQAASVGAHAVVIMRPDSNHTSVHGKENPAEATSLSAKAIRYKYFYY